MQKAKNFVESKRSVALAEQIHCIWYVISCSDERPIQTFDRKFFDGRLMDTGEIPIFLVFTKYDLWVRDVKKKLEKELNNTTGGELTPEMVEKKAFESFKDKIEGKIKPSFKDPTKVSICRMGIDGGVEYFPSCYQDGGRRL